MLHTFLNGNSLKVNEIAQLEFEFAYFDVPVQHVIHYDLGTSPINILDKRLSALDSIINNVK